MPKGIYVRHVRDCRSRLGSECSCSPSYQAHVWDNARGRRVRRTFTEQDGGEVAAKLWRRDAQIDLRRGREVAGRSTVTLRDASDQWLELARKGVVRARSGDEYKPSTIRSYETSLRLRVLDAYGAEPVADIRRRDLQDLVDEWVSEGKAAATVQATVIPLQSLFRWLIDRGQVDADPTDDLRTPAVRSMRDRVADPAEARSLLAVLPEDDRAIWATAMYTGLRRGEIMALTVDRIDLEEGLVDVRHGWDYVEGRIDTKGRNRRKVPVPKVLRAIISAHLLRTGRRGSALAFGGSDISPFEPRTLQHRADAAWEAAKARRITLHECRHTYAAFCIAAGVNAKALQTYMGHASIQTTFNLYGHLMPGSEAEVAALLDGYLDSAGGGA